MKCTSQFLELLNIENHTDGFPFQQKINHYASSGIPEDSFDNFAGGGYSSGLLFQNVT
jgi:hypothetical protein